MQSSAVSPIAKTCSRTMKTTHLLIRVVSSETFTRFINREPFILLQPQCVMRALQICIYLPTLYDDPWLIFKVRRNETICCLIGFGIGVGCCILYRFISNFLAPSSSTASISNNTLSALSNNICDAKTLQMGQEHSLLSSNGNEITVTYTKRPRSLTAPIKRTAPDALKKLPDENKCHCHHNTSNDSDREPLLGLPIDKHHSTIPNKSFQTSNLSDDTTWSDMSSSIGTNGLLQDSYHSNSLTGDSGVECQETSTIKMSSRHQKLNENEAKMSKITNGKHNNGNDDDDDENHAVHGTNSILFPEPRKYDSDTALSRSGLFQDTTQTVTESHIISYMSTEKGLERALEQTSRFYSDLEHIATDLNTLTKKYSQSQTLMSPSIAKYLTQHRGNTIDALDWDWNDVHISPVNQSPKNRPSRKQHHSSLSRLNNTTNNSNQSKYKTRKRLNNSNKQADYNESDLEIRTSFSYDCTTSSPLRRKRSSVYFDSTDNTSGDENFGDETLHMTSPTSVLNSSRTISSVSTSK